MRPGVYLPLLDPMGSPLFLPLGAHRRVRSLVFPLDHDASALKPMPGMSTYGGASNAPQDGHR